MSTSKTSLLKPLILVASAFAAAGALSAGCTDPEHPTNPSATPTAGPTASASASASSTAPVAPPKEEHHLADIKQLTFGGENAEAYWSFKGDKLIYQATTGGMGCDQIFTMPFGQDKPTPTRVSNGKGATTCAYFLPGDNDVVYASTHLGGDACPPKPDRSKGYVWALYDTYDIFRSKVDGSDPQRLTKEKGYDAEATVCGKDGSIVFTSVRDGDIELYRMDADGKNVKRLTKEPGYDGGAFFNEDCSKIVWRASRPKGQDLADYQKLLKENLVRPTKLELYVANADGSDAKQVTYLGVASFAPFFMPGSKRIIFSSNYGDPQGREFDLWAINVDGTQLERITSKPGFDGFPMFSPDGKYLAFGSNRATEPGKQDTNMFVARWVEGPIVPFEKTAADRIAEDAAFLADAKREGRGVGTKGLDEAGAFIEARFKDLKIPGAAAGDGGYRQSFDVTVAVTGEAKLKAGGAEMAGTVPLSFSKSATVAGPMVFAGYGIVADKIQDDYKGLDVKDKIVVVRRFVPETDAFKDRDPKQRHGDLRRKAWVARERGAKAIVIVDYPAKPAGANAAWKAPDEAKMPTLESELGSEESIPVVMATRASFSTIVDRLTKNETVEASLEVKLKPEKKPAFNVIAKLAAKKQPAKKGAIVIGAHYDHLGTGGHGSLAPGEMSVHHGADDNASGVAAMLEIARGLSQPGVSLDRDVVFVAFSAEERGLLGASFMTKNPPPGLAPKDIFAMINLDMVGRVRHNKIDIMGHDTAKELGDVVKLACDASKLGCNYAKGGGYGPSDHSAFYGAGVPVLFLFSGQHGDYHKPSDTADKLNAGGIAFTASLVQGIATNLASTESLTYVSVPSPAPKGDRRMFGASLGTVPDYAGSGEGTGVLLAGVRPGGAADKAGLKRGDLIVQIDKHVIKGVEDLMFVLTEAKPGQKSAITVLREGKRVKLNATFEASKR